MPTFTFEGPNGRTVTLEGPPGATREQAASLLRQQLAREDASEGSREVTRMAEASAPPPRDAVTGLDPTAAAYRLQQLPGDPKAPNVVEQFAGGAKHALDRAAMGVKGLMPESVQRAGDWVDEKLQGRKVLTPELLEQGEQFVKQTGPASTIGQIAGDVGITAPAFAFGGAALQAPRAAQMVNALRKAAPITTKVAGVGADVAANAGVSAALAPEDRGTAAAFGGAGALGGRVLNRALKGAVKPTDEAQAMLDKGVRLTPGQAGGRQGVGALADTYERALEAIPGVGKFVSRAKGQGLEDWNRQVLRGAEVPINPNRAGRAVFDVNKAAPVGREALEDLGTKYGAAYEKMLPEGVSIQLDAQSGQVYDNLTQRLAAKVAPSSRAKFHEVSQWVGQNLKEGVDASQWKEVVGGELDSAIKAAKRNGNHSLFVSLKQLSDELDKTLQHFPGMPAEASRIGATDKGYRTFKLLEKAMSKAGPLKREGVVYPSELATTAAAKGDKHLLNQAIEAQRVFGNAPNTMDKIANMARAGAVGAVGHTALGGAALPVAAVSLLGTTELGRRFLLGQTSWNAFAKAHPEIATQVSRSIATQQGQ